MLYRSDDIPPHLGQRLRREFIRGEWIEQDNVLDNRECGTGDCHVWFDAVDRQGWPETIALAQHRRNGHLYDMLRWLHHFTALFMGNREQRILNVLFFCIHIYFIENTIIMIN